MSKKEANAFIRDLHEIGHLLPEQEHINNMDMNLLNHSYTIVDECMSKVIKLIRKNNLFTEVECFHEDIAEADADFDSASFIYVIHEYHCLAIEALKDENGDVTYPYHEGITFKDTASLEEFESFAKEFFEILADLDNETGTEEALKLIAAWVISSGDMRKDIEKDLMVIFDLACDAQAEMHKTQDIYELSTKKDIK